MRKDQDRSEGGTFEKVELDLDKVRQMASIGCSVQDIADSLGVHENTIRRRAKDELRNGRAVRNTRLMQAMYTAAVKDGSVPMQKFLAMQWFDMHEKREYSDERLDAEIRAELAKRGIAAAPPEKKQPVAAPWGRRKPEYE